MVTLKDVFEQKKTITLSNKGNDTLVMKATTTTMTIYMYWKVIP